MLFGLIKQRKIRIAAVLFTIVIAVIGLRDFQEIRYPG